MLPLLCLPRLSIAEFTHRQHVPASACGVETAGGSLVKGKSRLVVSDDVLEPLAVNAGRQDLERVHAHGDVTIWSGSAWYATVSHPPETKKGTPHSGMPL